MRTGRWQVTLRATWLGAGERNFSMPLKESSIALAELWIPRAKKGASVLADRRLQGHMPLLEKVSQVLKETPLTEPLIRVPVDALLLHRDWVRLRHALQQVHAWPQRFWFTPVVEAHAVAPRFSRRPLSTGLMEAGYNVCYMNRNWDGIDRLDDLTDRHEFLDAAGTVGIEKQSLWDYMGGDLNRWMALLERGSFTEVQLQFEPLGEDAEHSLAQVLQRAERWRKHAQLPGYDLLNLEHVERHWDSLLKSRQTTYGKALDIGAYIAEMMRARWGGSYRKYEPKEQDDALLPSHVPQRDRKKPLNMPDIEPDVVLDLPFGRTLAPLHKALRSLLSKRKLAWRLQVEVLEAHRRQGALQQHLGRELYSSNPLRTRGALRLLWEIADLRVERLLAQRLVVEEDPLHLCVMMERLESAPKIVQPELLAQLAQDPDDAVASRALWLLFLQKEPQLPTLVERIFSGGQRASLRQLARHILMYWKSREAEAKPYWKGKDSETKKILRSLGPIPPPSSVEAMFPPIPGRWESLPLLSEILENCANPAKQEVAMKIVVEWPDQVEFDTLGSALADPDPKRRATTIGLLAESDRRQIRELLRTRLLFETDELCRRLLQAALAPHTN